jgi:histone-lysine N-methyltransferase SETMAR
MLKSVKKSIEIDRSKCKQVNSKKKFIALKMSAYVPTKQHLREILLYYFNINKNASEAHRLLAEAYPKYSMCQNWFRRFKDGDFDVEDKDRPGQPKKFEDAELEQLLDEDSCQTQKELADTLGVTQQAISVRLIALRFIQKLGNWVHMS